MAIQCMMDTLRSAHPTDLFVNAPDSNVQHPASSHLLLFLNLPNSDIGIARHSHTPGSDKKINGQQIGVHFFQFFRADVFFVVVDVFHKKNLLLAPAGKLTAAGIEKLQLTFECSE
jgi:hypothetical protein